MANNLHTHHMHGVRHWWNKKIWKKNKKFIVQDYEKDNVEKPSGSFPSHTFEGNIYRRKSEAKSPGNLLSRSELY
jgi:hypothetical protein